MVSLQSSFLHLFFGGLAVRGGVTGRPEFSPPYWYLAFFSDGFNILKVNNLITMLPFSSTISLRKLLLHNRLLDK